MRTERIGAHRRVSPAHQRGNALVFALLGLTITAIVAASTLQARRVQQKRDAGTAEATVLDNLRNAVNSAIYEQVVTLQAGAALTKNGVSVAPATVGADLVWQPTVADLAAMGYLPQGWTTSSSSLNEAPYAIRFQRVPTGCAPTSCGVEGRIVLAGPIRDTNVVGQVDSVVIGPILMRIGADSGVSLQASPTQITGFGNTWSAPNPVAGTPPGIVAVRVGTASAGFSQFVRINDSRDPNLQGNLSVSGNAKLGGALDVGGVTTLHDALSVKDASGNDCVQLLPDGTVNIRCSGQLNAKAGTFSDGAGNTSSITPTGISTTGDVSAGGRVGGQILNASATGTANTSCAGYQDGDVVKDAATDGTVLSCRGGVWRRPGLGQATVGSACGIDGAMAVDVSARGLICRSGQWRQLNDRVTSVVAMATFSGTGAGFVAAPACGAGGTPEVTVTPLETGADYGGIPPRNRYSAGTTWTGSGWSIDPALVDQAGNRYPSAFDGTVYGFAWTATTLCNYGVAS
jgi:hypothetical protein